MAPYMNPKISSADGLALGAVQIMIGLFHVLMWYLLLVLYMGQTKGVFGAYEPITYKAACSLWGVFFILSGISIIKVARDPNQRTITHALILSIICMVASVVALCLTISELSHFRSLSYRNYGQAKVGREISRVLMFSYPLEFSIALVYLILIYMGSSPSNEGSLTHTEDAESTF
ncbi:membrane-spanning 4-domains subfamily A member 13 [Tamandua tetradactyla]|uniref:membrane-spanning 4-domains subfamily A member 13 n=1 Tax=Tamandua tetradactyla TaxID=48850 RepID=UPI0040543919